MPDAQWTPMQRVLIDSMPGERVVPRAFEIAGRRCRAGMPASHVERFPRIREHRRSHS